MEKTIIIILVIIIIYLINRLINKNTKIKKISKDRDNMAINFSFLDQMTTAYLPGPSVEALEKINSGMLDIFSDRLENFYYHKFFANENTVKSIGELLLEINDKISDEERIDAIESILENAMLKASPELLANAIANILSDEQADRRYVLKYTTSTKNFILRNLSPEMINSFTENFNLRINEIVNNPDFKNGEVIKAHATLIKNDLKK